MYKISRFKQVAHAGAVFALAILILAAQALPAQTLDTGILGKVTDPPGAVIPGATVTITQPATGFTRSVSTGADGSYEVRYLQPGEYTLEVRMPGFRTERHTGIVLQLSQLARIDVTLQVGEIKETVEVSATPALLPTENAVLGEVVGSERVVNLP